MFKTVYTLTDIGNGFFVPTMIESSDDGVHVWYLDRAYYGVDVASIELEGLEDIIKMYGPNFYAWHEVKI